jgi:hypothetical protein
MAKWWILIVSLTCNLVAVRAEAATVQAASCSRTDVAAAITLAANGDTVAIPAGACTWTTAITLGSETTRAKMIRLVGAGTDLSSGTRITAAVSGGPILQFWLTHTIAPLEIANISFLQGSGWGNGDEETVWAIALLGHADTQASLFRIHHCHFQQATGNIVNSVRIGGLNTYGTLDNGHPSIWGLLDHNAWQGSVSFQGVDVMPLYSHDSSGAVVGGGNAGNLVWRDLTVADNQGTWRNVVLEDNTMTATGWTNSQAFMDGSGGSAYIFRRNVLRNNWVTNHGADSGWRSSRWMEIHDNIFVLDAASGGFTNAINSRGGTGVVYNNRFYDAAHKGTGNPYSITGAASYSGLTLGIEYYRANTDRGGDYVCASTRCGSDATLGCDNKDTSAGYICRDQPGATRGSAATGWAYGYRWAIEPYVLWNNYWADSTTLVPVTLNTWDFPNLSTYVQARRDYIDTTSCLGHMAEPICGAFWDATKIQKNGYVPLQYPHPMLGNSLTPPEPATNLRIIR